MNTNEKLQVTLDAGVKQGQRNPETVNDLFRGVHTL